MLTSTENLPSTPSKNGLESRGLASDITKAEACIVTRFADVASAVKSCTDIVLNGLVVPAATILDLTKLKRGTTITFNGTTVRAETPQTTLRRS